MYLSCFMTLFKNIKNINDESINYLINDDKDITIGSNNLTIIPALIDPHVHFRIPGGPEKENWDTAGQGTIAGGATMVFDMPNNNPPTIDKQAIDHKKKVISELLKVTQIPIQYKLWLGATPDNLENIKQLKDEVIGIKIFMGSSTGNLLVDKKEHQAKIFKTAAELDMVVAVHAEDEEEILKHKAKIKNPTVKDHSQIRHRSAAIKAVQQAIELARKYNTKLYICHVTTKEEIALVKQAKNEGLKVYMEVTPHHLFLTENDYDKLGAKAQMNPPLRTQSDQDALWQAIKDGIVDTIGSDHAPHRLWEKELPYPHSPSGVPGIETTLPLLLNAYNQNKITLEKIVELTNTNIKKIFNIPDNNDKVIINSNLEKKVNNKNLKTKCGWSPFEGWKLKGWPVYTIIGDKIFHLE